MKNITLSAEEKLIEEAREAARLRKTTLNQLFREWLEEIAERHERSEQLNDLRSKLSYANAGRSFSRDEMNER